MLGWCEIEASGISSLITYPITDNLYTFTLRDFAKYSDMVWTPLKTHNFFKKKQISEN
jgi:hypothetical protein